MNCCIEKISFRRKEERIRYTKVLSIKNTGEGRVRVRERERDRFVDKNTQVIKRKLVIK